MGDTEVDQDISFIIFLLLFLEFVSSAALHHWVPTYTTLN